MRKHFSLFNNVKITLRYFITEIPLLKGISVIFVSKSNAQSEMTILTRFLHDPKQSKVLTAFNGSTNVVKLFPVSDSNISLPEI